MNLFQWTCCSKLLYKLYIKIILNNWFLFIIYIFFFLLFPSGIVLVIVVVIVIRIVKVGSGGSGIDVQKDFHLLCDVTCHSTKQVGTHREYKCELECPPRDGGAMRW